MTNLRILMSISTIENDMNIMLLKDEIKNKNKGIAEMAENQSAFYAFIYNNLRNIFTNALKQ